MSRGTGLEDRGGSDELTAPDKSPGGKTTSSRLAGLGICEFFNFKIPKPDLRCFTGILEVKQPR